MKNKMLKRFFSVIHSTLYSTNNNVLTMWKKNTN